MSHSDSRHSTLIQTATCGTAPRTTLRGSVRQTLYGPRGWLRAGLLAAGIAGTPLASASPFPPVFHLADLLPPNGGDGSEGFVLPGIDPSDRAGQSVGGAGDINGDGIDDFVIGASNADPHGEIYVVFGSTQGFPAELPLASLLPSGGGDGSAGFVLKGAPRGGGAGGSVSAAGDVNADGIDDLIVGDTAADPGGRSNAGETYVIFGSRRGFPAVLPLARLFPGGGGDGRTGFVLTGIDPDDFSGFDASGAGDVNGDGIHDMIIGAPGTGRYGGDRPGEVYVVFGSTQGFPAVFPLARLLPSGGGDGSAGFVLRGIGIGDQPGTAVSGAGDINGDAIDDFVIGAPEAGRGESYVIFGSTEGVAALLPLAGLFPDHGGDGSAGFVIESTEANLSLGDAVSDAGDVNGDGIDDLIVGDPGAYSGPRVLGGTAFVVFGSTQGFPAVLPLASLLPPGGGDGSAGFALMGAGSYDLAGVSVSAAGDVNGDGIDDLIVGSIQGDPFPAHDDEAGAGESYVIFGSAQGFPAVIQLGSLDRGDGTVGFVLEGIQNDDAAGGAVGGVGDVNGDGIDDLLIGAFLAEPGGIHEAGECYVVFGRSEAR